MVAEIEMFEHPELTPLDFCLWGWMVGNVYKKEGRYTIRTAHSHFWCCCLHKETWRRIQTNNTLWSQSSYKVHWVWRWGFWTFIV